MAILAPLCRAERKRMQKLIQKTNDKHFARRLMAMLMLHQGHRLPKFSTSPAQPAPASADGWAGTPNVASMD